MPKNILLPNRENDPEVGDIMDIIYEKSDGRSIERRIVGKRKYRRYRILARVLIITLGVSVTGNIIQGLYAWLAS
jgi:hypothetical protein